MPITATSEIGKPATDTALLGHSRSSRRSSTDTRGGCLLIDPSSAEELRR
jgi:hypothetical protein